MESLSTPIHRRSLPRPLTAGERAGLLAAADALIPGTADLPCPSQAPAIDDWLDRALMARDDIFEEVLSAGARFGALPADQVGRALREMAAADAPLFGKLSTVLAGAYLLVPEVQVAIGYPNQERRFPPFDEAAEQILSGILDPVIERGTICVGTEESAGKPAPERPGSD